MKNPLVRNYLDSQKKAVEAVESSADDIGRDGLEKFKENCRVWLAGLWDELEPGEFHYVKEREGNLAASVRFIFHFTWQGVPGMITSCGWGRHSKIAEPWATLTFFNHPTTTESMRLRRDYWPSEQMSYNEAAKPLDDFEMGAFLYRVAAKMDELERKRVKDAETARDYALRSLERDFERCNNDDEVNAHLAECQRRAADEWLRWDEAAGAARKRIQAAKKEKIRIEEEYARWETEEKRLEALADKHFKRINIFEITCAVLPAAAEQDPDEEPRAAEKVFYAYAEQPDKDGWYTCLEFGRERKVKLRSIISIARISIDGPFHELVSTLYKHTALRSKVFTDLAVNFWALPGQEIPKP
jgi:hypothetical protein